LERVKVKQGRVEVSVNPAFYSRECVLRARKVFSGLAKISVKQSGNAIVVVLEPRTKVKLEEFGYEFYNHLLNAAKEARLGL